MPRRKGRATSEEITNPRPRNGNTYAVGAYLEQLREHRGIAREPLVREIINAMRGGITMSLSTLGQIENGHNKSVSAASIDAIRVAVGGDPYDLTELWKLPIPSDDDAEAIKAARNEGKARAIARIQTLGGMSKDSALQMLAESNPKEMNKILKSVDRKRLLNAAARLADNPKALAIIESILDGLD